MNIGLSYIITTGIEQPFSLKAFSVLCYNPFFSFSITAAAAAATNNPAQAAQAAQQAAQAAGNGYPNAANQPPPFVLQPHEQQAQFMAALALAGQPIPGK